MLDCCVDTCVSIAGSTASKQAWGRGHKRRLHINDLPGGATRMVSYEWLPGPLVPFERLEECAALYSGHYGRWSSSAPRPGQPIRLSATYAREWLRSRDSNLAIARTEEGALIGYAVTVRTKVEKYGIVSWVTQLVVHEAYRRANVAKTLLFSMWGFSDHFAWGLVTANPYAVRALEKATRRRCIPGRIARNHRKLKQIGIEHVPYVTAATEMDVTQSHSKINTHFHLDHSHLAQMIDSVTAPDKPWWLGELEEGWEWFAFTFRDQGQISLAREEIEEMLNASDQVTMRAYARMTLNEDHAWSQHTDGEVSFIIEECHLGSANSVLDSGCGDGRHSVALAKRGLTVVGVDYVGSRIQQARALGGQVRGIDVSFVEADSRTLDLHRRFDAAVCLYDVVGTYADDSDNLMILRKLYEHVKPGGYCLISVMNLDATLARAKNTFSISDNPDKLLKLPASHTMERTGDVFNPDYYLVDTASGVVYRKEQFDRGTFLPEELIVRDRRYTKNSIAALCYEAGLDVIWTRYVRAGSWSTEHDANTAKEILLLCRVPEQSAGAG